MTMRRDWLIVLLTIFTVWTPDARALPAEAPDSLVRASVSAQSDDDEESPYSFLNGVIPPTPQAAALARYGEHPVDLSTGLVDISVPVYTIRLGEFELPVSLSYHASGIKVSDIATPVGLGWVLNAGGAISRTICGREDPKIFPGTAEEYKYRNPSEIQALVNRGAVERLEYMVNRPVANDQYDYESDRYVYNFAGHSGVMRYDHTAHEFVPLNNDNFSVWRTVSGSGVSFTIIDSKGYEYVFDVPSCTGVSDEGMPPETSWSLSKISTPWGEIKFTYVDAPIYTQRFYSSAAFVGEQWRTEYVGDPQTPFEDYLDYICSGLQEYHTDFYYKEKLLTKIEWAGGHKITFDYSYTRDYQGAFEDIVKMPDLSKIEIYSREGVSGLIDRFTLTRTLWGNSIFNQRPLLTSVTSLQNGKHSFAYNVTGYLPRYNYGNGYPCDYWGYYNGNNSLYPQPREVIDKAVVDYIRMFGYQRFIGQNSSWANAAPDVSHALTGILTTITYPTGGSSTFEYELHRYANENYGGLRIARITTGDAAGHFIRKRYTYESKQWRPHPRDLMGYLTFVPYTLSSGLTELQTRINITASPYSPSGLGYGCQVFYTSVCETVNDEILTRTSFELAQAALGYPWNFDVDKVNVYPPQIQNFALYDEGNLRALPTAVVKTDLLTGQLLSQQIFTYETKEVRRFGYGVALAKPTPFDTPLYPLTALNLCHEPYFYFRPLTALVTVANKLSEKFVDHTTGVETLTTYAYDSTGYCVDHPRRVTTTLSDGSTKSTEFVYTGDRRDALCDSLYQSFNYMDGVRQSVTRVGSAVVSRSKTDYSTANSLPTARFTATSTADDPQALNLVERERVLSYNSSGKPLRVITEQTDTTIFTWANGVDLTSATAPGGLKTLYTINPLRGPASVTSPAGYKLNYAYGADSRLSSIADYRGTLSSYVYKIESRDGENSVTTTTQLSSSKNVTRKEYFDGLGRPSLTADNSTSTDKKYVYTSQLYDLRGRVTAKSLPAVGSTAASALTTTEMASLLASTYAADTALWSHIIYDGLSRPVFTSTPGNLWAAARKGRKTEYLTNGADDVRLYRAPLDNTSLVKAGFYPAGSLRGERSIDEDGLTLTVFTDLQGRKVLERRGEDNDTYYVYNDADQLRFILSPEYQKSGFRDKFAYEMRYDALGRVVKEFVPGCEYTQHWYDRAGRRLFTQDGRLRGEGLYRFTLYDGAGRPCVEGTSRLCTRSSAVNPVRLSANLGTLGGYVGADPQRLTVNQLERVTYYDSYGFLSLYGKSLPQLVSASASAKGRRTGVWQRLSDGSMMLEVMFYDPAGRVTATRVFGPYGRETATTAEYDLLTSEPTRQTYAEGAIAYTLSDSYNYANGALYESTLSMGSASLLVGRHGYDHFGHTVSVERGPWKNATRYVYDLHGRPTSITLDRYFSQNLYYASGPAEVKRYNGFLSAMSWKTGTGETRLRGYCYKYDALGRLTEAVYGENTSLTSDPNRYTERVLEYTSNGNIRRFQRHGLKDDGVYGKIDNLHLSYDGNQLKSILDDALDVTRYASSDFPDLSDKSEEYTYDACGAPTSDLNLGITSITYDLFGHPRRMKFASGEELLTVYTPDGRKVREIRKEVRAVTPSFGSGDISLGQTVSDTIDYVGPVTYEGRRPVRLRYAGGYASLITTASKVGSGASAYTPTFYFYVTDYQGNNRGVLNASSGTLDQITHYYPWGSPYADLGKSPDFQPYKFSDKELSTFAGVSRYDFSARTLFPALPRFDRPDPLAGKYPHISPYAFCANNPVNFTDPTGMDWVSATYESDSFYFWHDDIKRQEDIKSKVPQAEGWKYIGKTHTTTKDGKEITLSDGGHFSVNGHSPEGEYNSEGLHVGRSSLLQKDDNGNIIKNHFGHYIGATNPKLLNGKDSYALPPVNELDYAAFKHDQDYDAQNISGLIGVMSNKSIPADMKLIHKSANYMIEPGSRNKFVALGIISIFSATTALKSMSGVGLASIIISLF